MDAQQHDEVDSAADGAEATAPIKMASSRPDDPAVVAAEAGKTSCERSSESQGQHLPSRQHDRGPPLDDDLANDLLIGEAAVGAFLKSLGFQKQTLITSKKSAGRSENR